MRELKVFYQQNSLLLIYGKWIAWRSEDKHLISWQHWKFVVASFSKWKNKNKTTFYKCEEIFIRAVNVNYIFASDICYL